jgi:hypothetical protein
MLRFRITTKCFLVFATLVGTSAARADDAEAKKQSVKNMKELALALLNFRDTYDTFPPHPVLQKDLAKRLYSWRVDILPFIERHDLWTQIKEKEPWDSEGNKKLLDKMPKIYAPVTGDSKEKNLTHYQIIVGGGAMFDSKKRVKIKDITDGTSNTIMIVEAEEAVPWTKPADLIYDPEKPLPKFGGLFKDGFHVAFADGTVHFIKKGTDEKLIRALITRAGGEAVDLKKLK